MKEGSGRRERLLFPADVVVRKAAYLSQTDGRLFATEFGLAQVVALPTNADLAERVDAFVARFGRLQDTLAGGLLPRLLEALLEPVGSVLDNLNRAERLGWLRSAAIGPNCACCATAWFTSTCASRRNWLTHCTLPTAVLPT